MHKTEEFARDSMKLFLFIHFDYKSCFPNGPISVQANMHNAHNSQHTETCTHKLSHSTEPFPKPGLIFVWIIGLCAYRLHHIGRLKPYYQPIE